jgi:hypothetical protein
MRWTDAKSAGCKWKNRVVYREQLTTMQMITKEANGNQQFIYWMRQTEK